MTNATDDAALQQMCQNAGRRTEQNRTEPSVQQVQFVGIRSSEHVHNQQDSVQAITGQLVMFNSVCRPAFGLKTT